MKALNSRQALRLLGQFVLILFVTLLLLELATRLVWRDKTIITMFGRDIALLPVPLITEEQIDILEAWSSDDDSYQQFDPVLGWSIRPGVVGEFNGVTYTSNSIGIRSLREYDLNKPVNVVRIAAFGPSCTHSSEVQDSATWPALMEQSHPNLEVMNWGVGGYGTDQSFLRYKTQGVLYQPDIVLIGYEEDNMWRNVNRFRPYLKNTRTPLTKPVYIVEQNELVLLENPFDNFDDFYHTLLDEPNEFIAMTCPNDFFCDETMYRSYFLDVFTSFRFLRTLVFEIASNQSSRTDLQVDAQERSTRLIEMSIREATSYRSTPVVILFPHQSSTLSDYENGLLADYQKIIPLIRDKMGVQIIDLTAAFVKAKQEQHLEYRDFFVNRHYRGHYSELGNQVVAQAVLQQLCNSGLINC